MDAEEATARCNDEGMNVAMPKNAEQLESAFAFAEAIFEEGGAAGDI